MAVIVCFHIARENAPVRHAIRTQPLQDADSGWQFLCKAMHGNIENAQVWAVKEMLDYDSDVRNIIDQPVGSSFVKNQHNIFEKV